MSAKSLRAKVARREIGRVRHGGPRGHISIPLSEIDEYIRRHFRPAKERE